MFSEFETWFKVKSAEMLDDLLRQICQACGKEILQNYRKVTAYGLLGVGGAYCLCQIAAFANTKENEVPEQEPMSKLVRHIVASTNTTGTLTIQASASASGDQRGPDIPILSKIPAYEQEVEGIEWPVMPQSAFQGMVNQNGSERSKATEEITQRFYVIGIGSEVKQFRVVIR